MGLMKEIIRIHHTFFFLLIRHNKACLSSVSKVSGQVETWMLKISFWSVWISIDTTIKFYCFETRNKNPSAVNSFNIFCQNRLVFFQLLFQSPNSGYTLPGSLVGQSIAFNFSNIYSISSPSSCYDNFTILNYL